MLTDNLPYKAITDIACLKDERWEMLNSISHRSIAELCDEEKGLLVFPHCLGGCKKEFREAHILKISKGQISTGNIVGFIGVKDKESDKSIELTIHSRFHQGKNGEDYFLHYMLQKVFNVTILDLKHSTADGNAFDFAMYLFPYYLKRAIKQGLFKQYRKCEYNDANVRGVIDVSRHIRHNIPFNGRIAYRTSEYKYDNAVTQLIRHTIEYIRTSKWAGNILKCDKDMCENVRTIYDITPSYKPNDRQKVIAQNLKPLNHPFYTEYRTLQQLCLHILHHKGIKYGKTNEKIYGILFDCAWLWEEYLATILTEKGFTHAGRDIGHGYPFFDGGWRRYPDFYSIDKRIVLDAKYKNIECGFGQREDQFQLIAYMHTLPDKEECSKGAELGALVYPTTDKDKEKVKSKIKRLNGVGGLYGTIPILIPSKANNWTEFCSAMEEATTKVHNILNFAEEFNKDSNLDTSSEPSDDDSNN